jgi:hypothetical protein
MTQTERDALIATLIRDSKVLFTIDETALLTQRHRQAIERLVRTSRIHAFIDPTPGALYKHLIPARQVAALLETPLHKHVQYVGGTPIEEARRQAIERRQQRGVTIKVGKS